MYLAESWGFPRPLRGRSASRAKALERIAKTAHWAVFLTRFHLNGSNLSIPE